MKKFVLVIITYLLTLNGNLTPVFAEDDAFWKEARELYKMARTIKSAVDGGMIVLDFKRAVVDLKVAYDSFIEDHPQYQEVCKSPDSKIDKSDECIFLGKMEGVLAGYELASSTLGSGNRDAFVQQMRRLGIDLASGSLKDIKDILDKHR